MNSGEGEGEEYPALVPSRLNLDNFSSISVTCSFDSHTSEPTRHFQSNAHTLSSLAQLPSRHSVTSPMYASQD